MYKSNTINTLGVECQIGMQRPYLCAKPRHFCTLDVATFKKVLDFTLEIYVQVLLVERYIARQLRALDRRDEFHEFLLDLIQHIT